MVSIQLLYHNEINESAVSLLNSTYMYMYDHVYHRLLLKEFLVYIMGSIKTDADGR